MATTTDKMGLILPSGSDPVSVEPINENFKKLDALVGSDAQTVKNADRLGGKAPEYYIQPRNLLDNSDFRTPVNQRGQTSYSGITHSIDRWKTFSEDTVVTITGNGLAFTGANIAQIVPVEKMKTGQAYTFAAKQTNGTVRVVTGTYPMSSSAAANGLILKLDGLATQYAAIVTAGTYEWTALYEGTYTADTLPPFVPPDYYNELLKMREYHHGEGYDLRYLFDGDASKLMSAVRDGDFSKIRVGDYWPITLNGTIYDYASASGKTLSNAIIKLEVAGVNFYRQYGDTAVPNHLLFCSRDLLPWPLMFRSENTTWYDAAATNPWLGSHLYQTLNNTSNGLLPLVAATDIGAYIYAGPNGNGMRFLGETKGPTATTATGWAWTDRGKLFLPSEREVWGGDTWSEHGYGGGLALQWPIFAGTMRHIIKGLGNGGSRYYWWCCSSHAGSSDTICCVTNYGLPRDISATTTWMGAPVCFLVA